MKYIEVLWSEHYDNEIEDEEYMLEWHNKEGLPKAYVPEEMVSDEVSIELAFERLTGIDANHIVMFDMTPEYVLNEELEFIHVDEVIKH